MKTSFLSVAALALLALASSCAEPIGATGVPAAAGKGGKTAATGSGGNTATSTDSGGTTGTTTTTTSTASGGTTGTTTSTSSGGTTTTTAEPVDCGTTSGELVLANTPRVGTSDIGDAAVVSVPAGATVAAADILIKFCFGVLGTSTTAVSSSAVTVDSAAFNTKVAPYYLDIKSSMKITTETTTDGGACVVFNVGSVAGVETLNLSGTDTVKVDFRFVYGGLDRSKPAQIVALRAGAAAACSGLTLTAGTTSTATTTTTTTGVGGKTSTTTATTATAGSAGSAA